MFGRDGCAFTGGSVVSEGKTRPRAIVLRTLREPALREPSLREPSVAAVASTGVGWSNGDVTVGSHRRAPKIMRTWKLIMGAESC